jgi:isopentenyldiphosphate isomerase
MYAPQQELVTIVDEENREVGAVTRREMREGNLFHRATYVFVFDSEGKLYVQHRTLIKDVYPGYWDLAAGGVVLAGESYALSAARELEEELGIAGVPLHHWFEFYFEDLGSRVFGAAYSCTYEGPLRLQPEEVQSVERLSIAGIFTNNDRSFTPDSMFALQRYLSQKS